MVFICGGDVKREREIERETFMFRVFFRKKDL